MKKTEETRKIFSIANFNPPAVFCVILLLIGLTLSSIATGLTSWISQEVERRPQSSEGNQAINVTTKTLGLTKRCISYRVSNLLMNIPSNELPQDKCVALDDLDCSAVTLLVSAYDSLSQDEVRNIKSEKECVDAKGRMTATLALMVVGIGLTFVASILYLPLWYRIIHIGGLIAIIASLVVYIAAIAIFASSELSFGGFFSLNGLAESGCFSYGFGLAVAGFIVNAVTSMVGVAPIFYTKIRDQFKKEK